MARDTLIGLGRFELQSYGKVGIEVEHGCAEHTAHCFVMSRTIKGISVQSSQKLLENGHTSQPESSPTMFAIHLLHFSVSPSLGSKGAEREQEAHPQSTYLSSQSFPPFS